VNITLSEHYANPVIRRTRG